MTQQPAVAPLARLYLDLLKGTLTRLLTDAGKLDLARAARVEGATGPGTQRS